jgi:DNA-nicking Smr family endonuclease/ubiquinone/menaquinone biosynthesis C-methylase UbiE
MQSRIPVVVWRLYDALMALLGRMGLARARQRLVSGASGRTLEVGAGTGLNLPLYPAAAAPLVAVDESREALARARGRGSRAALVRARVEALPFAEATFDTVVGALVFCTVAHPREGLVEVRRVLRPAGQLRLLEHVRPPGPLLGALATVLSPLWRLIPGGCHLDRRTRETIKEAGLAEVTVQVGLGGAGLALQARAATAAELAAAREEAARMETARAEAARLEAARAEATRKAAPAASATGGKPMAVASASHGAEAVREIPIDGTLDLHTVQPGEARAMVEEYLEVCLERGIHDVRVIHGKGTGVLRLLVHAALSRSPLVRDFRPADEAAGGWGATLVRLRPRAEVEAHETAASHHAAESHPAAE